MSDPCGGSDHEEAFSLLVVLVSSEGALVVLVVVMIGPTSRILSNYSLPMLTDPYNYTYSESS